MKRALPARHVARRLVELELQNPREEVAGVRRVAGDVILRARIERVRRPLDPPYKELPQFVSFTVPVAFVPTSLTPTHTTIP